MKVVSRGHEEQGQAMTTVKFIEVLDCKVCHARLSSIRNTRPVIGAQGLYLGKDIRIA